MNRRSLLKGGLLAGLSAPLVGFKDVLAAPVGGIKKAKNIIMMVSDGMSIGTLNMADLYASRTFGKSSKWLGLYRDNKAVRALMDTASASSMVTDSAAASSSWGGGLRVRNGSLNVGMKGEKPQPILQKFKEKGKKVGCVTTVPITHATPAGFCVNLDNRGGQDIIAEIYLGLKFDVMMGGGSKYFGEKRAGGNLLPKFLSQGYRVAENRNEMLALDQSKPILGLFAEDGLPYEVDRMHDAELQKMVPTLAEMTVKAIDLMKDHRDGFALQIEGGKVDWAAHSNDLGGLIFDQLAFDEAVGKVIEFAEKDGETLVIITTDHGNANPGLFYADEANKKFDSLQNFKHSNTWLLAQLNQSFSEQKIMEMIKENQGIEMKADDVKSLLAHFKDIVPNQLYNEANLPFYEYGKILSKYTDVQWAGMNHTGDYVELTMFGPGSELLKPFVKNYELHNFMLKAAEMPEHFLVRA
ncbi:alkaline phosphatase [Pedobacter sp. Leaf216]|uniref:alkaline phosphatase n=1 Tax=Pedobacter sp. Leaf216 TaxID=1735684 RepID=UPI0006FEF492|nr:alkaline phosphatase [Pedobacter sp. Leaf216]KQM72926.1 alkaline phosphatase [Pedobacter sp. Leaf216]